MKYPYDVVWHWRIPYSWFVIAGTQNVWGPYAATHAEIMLVATNGERHAWYRTL